MQAVNIINVGSIKIIALNRPKVKNAIDAELAMQLVDALEGVEKEDISVVIITGKGGFFSSGLDLNFRNDPATLGLLPFNYRTLIRNPPNVPLIAAIEGGAIGGGLELALMCDFIITAADAVFALPEVSLGLAPTQGGITRFLRRCPSGIVGRMIFAGDRYTGKELEKYNLFTEVTEPRKAFGCALGLARDIVQNVSVSLPECLEIFRATNSVPEELWRHQDNLFDPIFLKR
jgi:enoyl-coA hydratase